MKTRNDAVPALSQLPPSSMHLVEHRQHTTDAFGIAIVQQDRRYDATPTGRDVFFVVEVSETTRGYDRGTKMPLYAAAGIAEAWLVDLIAERIKRYTDPQDGRYRAVMFANRGESLPSTAIPALVMDADAILGP